MLLHEYRLRRPARFDDIRSSMILDRLKDPTIRNRVRDTLVDCPESEVYLRQYLTDAFERILRHWFGKQPNFQAKVDRAVEQIVQFVME